MTITIKQQKNADISNLIDVFNTHPNINWEVNKAINLKSKNGVIFTFFDKVSHINALKIVKLLN